MRFLIRIAPDWNTTITTPQGTVLATRQLELRTVGKFSYPLPPPNELPNANAPHYPLCRGDAPELIDDLKKNIDNRRIKTGEVENFARYLFDTLLGETAWTAIQNAMQAAAPDALIELALLFEQGVGEAGILRVNSLHRLNWELMKSAQGFLAAGIGNFAVAFTRLIKNEELATPDALDMPPRILFVLGAELTDPQIRPGAELFGLLRQIKSSERAIHWRVLENASPKRLEAMLKTFQPHVVHFICHGYHDAQGNALLELRSDETSVADARPAAQILQYLKTSGKIPLIVVLSACYTATTGETRLMNAGQTAPLASELVMGGVPVVIGMAGRVADIACRLFTRRFGEALIAGESIVQAGEVARRATFAVGANPKQSIDWALPAVFVASNVGEAYKPVQPQSQDTSALIESWIARFRVEELPVFCGRDEFFQAFYELFDPEPGQVAPKRVRVLAAFTESPAPGIGRKRLLKELTIQTLRDGHIPLLIIPPEPSPPTTLAQFANLLREKCELSAEILLGDESPRASQLRGLTKPTADALADAQLDDRIKQELQDYSTVTPAALRRALRMDCSKLAKLAREKYPTIQRNNGRVVVLLNGIDRWDGVTAALLGEDSILDAYGFGTDQEPIPVVMTFSLHNVQSNLTNEYVDKLGKRWWIKTLPLRPFEPNGEDMMAYALVLLHPFDPAKYTDISNHAWAVNDDVSQEIRAKWEARFRKRLKGLPNELGGDAFYMLAEDSQDDEFVIAADDEQFLKLVLKKQ